MLRCTLDVTRLFKISLVHDLGDAIGGGDIPAPVQARQLAAVRAVLDESTEQRTLRTDA